MALAKKRRNLSRQEIRVRMNFRDAAGELFSTKGWPPLVPLPALTNGPPRMVHGVGWRSDVTALHLVRVTAGDSLANTVDQHSNTGFYNVQARAHNLVSGGI